MVTVGKDYTEGIEVVPRENTWFGKYGRDIAYYWAFIENMCYVNKMNEAEKAPKFLADRNIVFYQFFFLNLKNWKPIILMKNIGGMEQALYGDLMK